MTITFHFRLSSTDPSTLPITKWRLTETPSKQVNHDPE